MLVGLNQGFGELIGQERMHRSMEYAVDVVRQDIPHDLTQLDAIMSEFRAPSPTPIFLLHHREHITPVLDAYERLLSPRRVMFQMWNEPPGLDKITWDEYVLGINDLVRAVRDRGLSCTVIAGGLANIGRDNRAIYAKVIPLLPREVWIDFHRYSYRTQTNPNTPWPNFSSRKAEIDWMHSIAADRPICITEGASYHTMKETETRYLWDIIPLPWTSHTVQLTNQGVLDRTVADLKLYDENAVALVCLYQERDGPEQPEGSFGYFLDYQGNVKPQANAIRIFKGLAPL